MRKSLREKIEDADLAECGIALMGGGLGLVLITLAVALLCGGIINTYCRISGNCKADQIRAKADITISSAPAEGGK